MNKSVNETAQHIPCVVDDENGCGDRIDLGIWHLYGGGEYCKGDGGMSCICGLEETTRHVRKQIPREVTDAKSRPISEREVVALAENRCRVWLDGGDGLKHSDRQDGAPGIASGSLHVRGDFSKIDNLGTRHSQARAMAEERHLQDAWRQLYGGMDGQQSKGTRGRAGSGCDVCKCNGALKVTESERWCFGVIWCTHKKIGLVSALKVKTQGRQNQNFETQQ
ncbi:hypothetical protein SISSUDRAFT_1037615 [Sistotremastrum suecicum HHB10207 ss-3]|uniref:Uncharacterized protein n=1 Tax=Sistotremastrum suecicum HHB10207 ss-3 TaxID=1314776 RepID=A0A165XWC2_9AGAM|nr:hypothetical protein SISSUDRAFT_1037615 [Sistotremastrum suecicum HHB10207 ss-3]